MKLISDIHFESPHIHRSACKSTYNVHTHAKTYMNTLEIFLKCFLVVIVMYIVRTNFLRYQPICYDDWKNLYKSL